MYREAAAEYALYPFIILSETAEGDYLPSLVFQVERGEWMSRYFYHMPWTLPADSVAEPSEQQLAELARLLDEGGAELVSILERLAHKELPAHGEKVTVGSLYFLSGNIGGLVDPKHFFVKNAELLWQGDTDLILRVPGDPKIDAAGGGLAFGVHYFQRKQLHTFERQ